VASFGGRLALTPRSTVVKVLLSFREFNYQMIPRVPLQARREAHKLPGRHLVRDGAWQV